MSTKTRARRVPSWDRLEDRTCRSGLVAAMEQATAADAVATTPTPRTDAAAVSLDLQYARDAATMRPNVIFFGDSIGYMFEYMQGSAAWNQDIAPLNAVSFGVASDKTANLLYRLEAGGELVHPPKVAVVEIGVNNIGDGAETAQQTIAGIEAVVRTLRTEAPRTKILLLGVFPSDIPTSPHRATEEEVNAEIARLANGTTILFANPGFTYLAPDGSDTAYTIDRVHPNAAGFAVVAAEIAPILRQMLGMEDPAHAARH